MRLFHVCQGRFIAVATLAMLAGCNAGPNFTPPRAAVPAAYLTDAPLSQLPYVSGDPVDPNWWNSFDDPMLTKLETLAASQNLDLRIATERLLEAEAQAQITGAALYPNLAGAASFTREAPSKEGIFNAFGGRRRRDGGDRRRHRGEWHIDIRRRRRRVRQHDPAVQPLPVRLAVDV